MVKGGKAMFGEATHRRTHAGIKHNFPRGDIIQSDGSFKSCYDGLDIWDITMHLPGWFL